jgi:hypothetical protein
MMDVPDPRENNPNTALFVLNRQMNSAERRMKKTMTASWKDIPARTRLDPCVSKGLFELG